MSECFGQCQRSLRGILFLLYRMSICSSSLATVPSLNTGAFPTCPKMRGLTRHRSGELSPLQTNANKDSRERGLFGFWCRDNVCALCALLYFFFDNNHFFFCRDNDDDDDDDVGAAIVRQRFLVVRCCHGLELHRCADFSSCRIVRCDAVRCGANFWYFDNRTLQYGTAPACSSFFSSPPA